MEIQHLRHMLAAAYSPSYAQAAKKCFTSRQNIAHSIKVLENELNVTLFKREGNEMVLTPEGVEVARRADDVVARVDDIRVMFIDSGAPDTSLNLAVSTNLFAGVPTSVNSLFSDYPGGARIFELEPEGCYRYVCSEKVDVALVMCMEREFPDCNVFEIADSISYALVSASSPLAKLSRVTAANMVDQRLFVMSEPDFQYMPLFSKLAALGYDRVEASVISSTSSVNHLVRRSQGIGIVSEKFAMSPPEGTVAIPIFDPELNWHFYMLYQMSTKSHSSIMKLAMDVRALFENDGGCGTISQSF